MKVCKIWDSDYPWDVRVEKICMALTDAGHEVHLVCRNKEMKETYEYDSAVHIHRLPSMFKSKKLNELSSFPAFFNPLWIYKVWQTIKENGIDIILVRDLPLALTAITLGKIAKIPVILDMAENYPQMVKDMWNRKGFKLRNLLVRNPFIVKLVELISLKYADHVIVVVKESAERLANMGAGPDKTTIVMNTPPLDRCKYSRGDYPEPSDKTTDAFTIVYLGLLEFHRGIETAIKAMQIVAGKAAKSRLIIIGSGKDEQYFRSLAQDLKLTGRVEFKGYMKYESALKHICSSDVGIVPHHATQSWNTTIPNKLFDYMSLGKPVIVSDALPTKRIVTNENCGLVFQDRDATSLASAIIRLYENKELRKDSGRRGFEAIVREYNWERDASRLIRLIDCYCDMAEQVSIRPVHQEERTNER